MRDNDSYTDMAKYLETLLKSPAASSLGLAAVYFGDQQNIPHTPTACIDPGGKTRIMAGAPRRTDVTITNYVIVYHYELKPMQMLQEDADRLAEAVEKLIHQDAYMNNSVIDSMVTAIESGYLMRRNAMYRASRLTVEARAIKQLPSQF